jgi:NAD(P)-dependent dehydrogenase (short-subunit alcohol dehydrogenase family)
MMRETEKKHSVVVGGTRGIGREVVRIFSEQLDLVSVIGRHAPSEADKALSGTVFWAVDVTEEDARNSILSEIVSRGRIKCLVLLQRLRANADRWADELNVSLGATMAIIEKLACHFDGSGCNSIVLVSSIVDRFVAASQCVGYHVAKAGLVNMARYYAVTLATKGIRVNSVSPCTVLKAENEEFYLKSPELHDLFCQTVPLGRMGTARDAANVIAFLCSDLASFVTGQNIVVDGGVSLLSQEGLARTLKGI